MALSAAVLSTACSAWHPRGDARDQLDLLTRALAADAPAREAMWRAAPAAQGPAGAQLGRALLQSVPGHSGSDPAAAEKSLQAILERDPPADVAAVARLRLAQLRTELRGAADCRQEVAALRQRLAQVVDIERNLNSNGR